MACLMEPSAEQLSGIFWRESHYAFARLQQVLLANRERMLNPPDVPDRFF